MLIVNFSESLPVQNGCSRITLESDLRHQYHVFGAAGFSLLSASIGLAALFLFTSDGLIPGLVTISIAGDSSGIMYVRKAGSSTAVGGSLFSTFSSSSRSSKLASTRIEPFITAPASIDIAAALMWPLITAVLLYQQTPWR